MVAGAVPGSSERCRLRVPTGRKRHHPLPAMGFLRLRRSHGYREKGPQWGDVGRECHSIAFSRDGEKGYPCLLGAPEGETDPLADSSCVVPDLLGCMSRANSSFAANTQRAILWRIFFVLRETLQVQHWGDCVVKKPQDTTTLATEPRGATWGN